MSEHNVIMAGGSSVRLPTAGKYCDRDIVITAEPGGVELPELTSPGAAADLMTGKQLIDSDGKVVDGTFTLANEMTEQDSLIAQIKTALQGKTSGGSGLPTQEKTVEITENGTHEIVPDDGYVLTKVTANINVSSYDPRSQYQRVEYIESAEEGTYPYIITDFYADNESGVEIIASFPILQDRIPMGSRQNSDATRFYCVYPMSASSVYHGFNTGVTTSCQLKVNTIYRLQTNFLNSRLVNVYDENGSRKGGTSISVTLTPQHTVPVSIFGYNSASSGAVTSKREYKLYGARCSKGHEVVREYIPCYRKNDGVIGLYEKFTGQFLINDAGNGSAFVCGADIEW